MRSKLNHPAVIDAHKHIGIFDRYPIVDLLKPNRPVILRSKIDRVLSIELVGYPIKPQKVGSSKQKSLHNPSHCIQIRVSESLGQQVDSRAHHQIGSIVSQVPTDFPLVHIVSKPTPGPNANG